MMLRQLLSRDSGAAALGCVRMLPQHSYFASKASSPRVQNRNTAKSARGSTKFRKQVPSKNLGGEGMTAKERRADRRRHLQRDDENKITAKSFHATAESTSAPAPVRVAMHPTTSPCLFVADVPGIVALGGADGLVPGGIEVGSIGFVSPASLPDQAPPPVEWGIPEFSFVGRSNAGKSSLIKTVMKNISGAGKIGDRVGPRVGKTPGKTKVVNYFGCWGSNDNESDLSPRNCNMFMIDLPGYGYAATAGVEEKELWEERSLLYLQSRAPILQTGEVLPCIYENVLAPLNTCFLLVDSRRDPIMTELDFEYLDYLDEHKIPVCVVLTKIDKINTLSRLKAFNEMSIVVQQRHQSGFTQLKPEVLGCSSHSGEGINEIVDYMKSGGVWRDEFYPKEFWEEEEEKEV